jgi:glycosyltransferase involved in cell wall biosynthesis
VLIPSRNRGELLGQAIESVLAQDYDKIEVVVSDNASSDNTAAIISSFDDPRLNAIRVKEPLSLVDNWNMAWRHAHGDYVIMMGDDDYLLPGAVTRYMQVIAETGAEMVGSSVALYCFPDYPNRRFRNTLITPTRRSRRFLAIPSSALLDTIFGFRYPFATQTVMYSRRLLQEIGTSDVLYRPPYPDHYCAGAALLHTDRMIMIEQPLMIAGATASSSGVGLVYAKDRERRWRDEQKSSAPLKVSLDGQAMYGTLFVNGYYESLTQLQALFPDRARSYDISVGDYSEASLFQLHQAERAGRTLDEEVRRPMRAMIAALPYRRRLRVRTKMAVDAARGVVPLGLINLAERLLRGKQGRQFVALPKEVTSSRDCAKYALARRLLT